MNVQTLAVIACTAVASSGATAVAVQLATPVAATADTGDTRIVKELRMANATLAALQAAVGQKPQVGATTVLDKLKKVCQNMSPRADQGITDLGC